MYITMQSCIPVHILRVGWLAAVVSTSVEKMEAAIYDMHYIVVTL